MQDQYIKKVQLLLECLPEVAEQECFALKGGTAINLFINQEFPRLSVDIDLTYLPIEERATTLIGIEQGLLEIARKIQQKNSTLKIKQQINNSTNSLIRIAISNQDTMIKIEPNLIFRGNVYPVVKMDLVTKAEQQFNISAINVPVMAQADVYAGKICAALDRQHPRDLFDIFYLLKQGFTKEIKNAFLVYLISCNRPMHEILQPNRLDKSKEYRDEFFGMANFPVEYHVLETTREKLIQSLYESLTENDKQLLISIKKGEPDWAKFIFPDIYKLPSIQWKLINLSKMDVAKKKTHLEKLIKVLYQ